MAIDCSVFNPINVIDTCAIWNVLSSQRLTRSTVHARCNFSVTQFVEYEALHKKRSTETTEDRELQARLVREKTNGLFGSISLSIADLQDVDLLEKRMRLGKGELSAIAAARTTGLSFMTDDQNARRLGADSLGSGRIQTTPHLFGWLFFSGHLVDSDKDHIIAEHESLSRPLKPYFEEMYKEALRCRLMDQGKRTS